MFIHILQKADDANFVGEIYTLYDLSVWFCAEKGFLSIDSLHICIYCLERSNVGQAILKLVGWVWFSVGYIEWKRNGPFSLFSLMLDINRVLQGKSSRAVLPLPRD